MKVKCPTCGKDTEYAPANSFRPFCSERCQTLDLGAWADEKYRVPLNDQEHAGVNGKSPRESDFDDAPPPKDHLN
ncbi:MAG: DNA gyrase inhibitor YacG [Bdellovibrionales bacterium]|nr:DNA gyrase inhibitor YacG [Bdellovibrionales bacterium]